MSKLYAIPMVLYVEALNPDMAAARAELGGFSTTEALRKTNSTWVTDNVTCLVTNGQPSEAAALPEELYHKDILIKAYGEEKAIRFLNHTINTVHP